MSKEEKLELFKKEFPGFLEKVYDYNQNMILFHKIDDIGLIQMCKDFYYKHEDIIPKDGTITDVWSWINEINRCYVSLYRSWHPEERGMRLSPMFVQNVLLK